MRFVVFLKACLRRVSYEVAKEEREGGEFRVSTRQLRLRDGTFGMRCV